MLLWRKKQNYLPDRHLVLHCGWFPLAPPNFFPLKDKYFLLNKIGAGEALPSFLVEKQNR